MPKNLYIVGAGASSEAELPTGDKLKQEIAQFLDIKFIDDDYYNFHNNDITESNISQAIKLFVNSAVTRDIQPYIYAAQQITKAMPLAISIDNFIDNHNGNKEIELCGKLAIVQSILNAEKNSLLCIKNYKLDFKQIENTWYVSFLKLLTENCTKENLSSRLKSIALIVFNYDRCIEHFLYNAFQTYYGITPQESVKFVNEIEIYHPYGTVGNLPWQNTNKSIEFGEIPSPEQLLELAGKIKTFTEGTDPDSSEIDDIRKNVLEANNIIFLGFAFHELNMKLMSPNESLPEQFDIYGKEPEISYFGTAYGMSDNNCNIIKSELKFFRYNDVLTDEDFSNSNMYINNKLTCSGLFNEYWRSLSLN